MRASTLRERRKIYHMNLLQHTKHTLKMKIDVIDADNVGQNLTLSWIRHGHDIMLSRDTSSEQLHKRI